MDSMNWANAFALVGMTWPICLTIVALKMDWSKLQDRDSEESQDISKEGDK